MNLPRAFLRNRFARRYTIQQNQLFSARFVHVVYWNVQDFDLRRTTHYEGSNIVFLICLVIWFPASTCFLGGPARNSMPSHRNYISGNSTPQQLSKQLNHTLGLARRGLLLSPFLIKALIFLHILYFRQYTHCRQIQYYI